MHERETFGTSLTQKQLLQKFVFDSACEIQSSRQLTLDAAKRIDQGDDARIEIGLIKVLGAQMLHNVIDRKWFTTGASRAAYTTVMCKTELDAPGHGAFSMIIVPTDNPGYKIIRETPVLGINGGHYEVEYNNVEVPEENLLGPRGHGFLIAQKRLGPGRIFHCMRWLGQALSLIHI